MKPNRAFFTTAVMSEWLLAFQPLSHPYYLPQTSPITPAGKYYKPRMFECCEGGQWGVGMVSWSFLCVYLLFSIDFL